MPGVTALVFLQLLAGNSIEDELHPLPRGIYNFKSNFKVICGLAPPTWLGQNFIMLSVAGNYSSITVVFGLETLSDVGHFKPI